MSCSQRHLQCQRRTEQADYESSGTTKSTTSRGPLRYNDFGYTIGVPVWLPKIYDGRKHGTYRFFFSRGFAVSSPTSHDAGRCATLDERAGKFTVPVCTAANTVQVTGKCTNSGTTNVAITQPPGSGLSKDIYSSVGQPDNKGNMVSAPQRNLFNGNQQIVRIDQQLGQS